MLCKAISLRQPYASWVCSGRKKIETRTWDTKYRGDLVICSSQSPRVKGEDGEVLPTGQALCVVEVYDTEPMRKGHEEDACCEVYERSIAWHLRNLRPISPVPVKGKLGIYDLEIDLWTESH